MYVTQTTKSGNKIGVGRHLKTYKLKPFPIKKLRFTDFFKIISSK